MPPEFFDPTPEEQVIVLVGREAMRNAEGFIKSCEQSNPEGAEWPFSVGLRLCPLCPAAEHQTPVGEGCSDPQHLDECLFYLPRHCADFQIE